MQFSEETRRIGREIKNFLAVNRISREQFCFETKLGKSTVDKLISGRFSEATLQIVLERTKFVTSNSYAAKQLGAYARADWSTYLADYLFLQPSLAGTGTIDASRVRIEWDEALPGMVLTYYVGKSRLTIGTISIPHERSPLIYVHPPDNGRYLVVSTMLGEPVMRGLMLTVDNLLAHAFVPVALPVLLRRLAEKEQIDGADLGTIPPDHPKFAKYAQELRKTLDKQFGRLIALELPSPVSPK